MVCCKCVTCPPIFEKMGPTVVAISALSLAVTAVAVALLFTPIVSAVLALNVVAAVVAVGVVFSISLIVWSILRAQNSFITDAQRLHQENSRTQGDLLKTRITFLKLFEDNTIRIQGAVVTDEAREVILQIAQVAERWEAHAGQPNALGQLNDDEWNNFVGALFGLLEKKELDLSEDAMGPSFTLVWNQVRASVADDD